MVYHIQTTSSLQPPRYYTDFGRCRIWRCHSPSSHLVDQHPLADNTDVAEHTYTVATTMVYRRYPVASPFQSDGPDTPTRSHDQRLGNTSRSPCRPKVFSIVSPHQPLLRRAVQHLHILRWIQLVGTDGTANTLLGNTRPSTSLDDGEWQPVTPLQRERMMGLPDDFTLIHPNHPDDRARNTMLGNTWHVPSAVWLLFLLLLQPSIAMATPIKVTTLQKMTSISPPDSPSSCPMPQYDWMSHLRWTREHIAQLHVPPAMDPTVHWALSQQTQLPNIHQIRLDVIADIQQLVSDWQDHTHTHTTG